MSSWALRVATLSSIAALSACAGPTSDLDFKPPPGWNATPSLFGRVQIWIKGIADKNHRQFLFVVKANPNQRDVFYNPYVAESSVRAVRHERIHICGDREAPLVIGAGGQPPSQAEAVTTRIGDTQYVAVYIRKDAHDPPDPGAEAAIRSLCPKR